MRVAKKKKKLDGLVMVYNEVNPSCNLGVQVVRVEDVLEKDLNE